MCDQPGWTLEFKLVGDGSGVSYGFVKALSQLGAVWHNDYTVHVPGLSTAMKDSLLRVFTPERTGMSVTASSSKN